MRKVKQTLNILTLAILTITLTTSCGGGVKEISVKPISNVVKGDLSNFFEVVAGAYKLERGQDKKDDYKMKVQLKRNDMGFDFDAKDLESRGYFNLCCSLLDEGGAPIVLGSTDGMGVGTAYTGRKELTTLKSGEISWVEFTFTQDELKELANVKTFEINSNVRKEMGDSSGSNSSDNNESTSSSTSSSGDCDQFIKEYSDFVNSYIKLIKKYKSNPTDATIMQEYTEAVSKASEMQSNAASCSDAKYASKIMELNNKLSQAIL